MSSPDHLSPGSARILLVDHDALIRSCLDALFRCEGWQVTTCHSALAGLRALEEQPFDLVLSEYLLPDRDGVSFLREVACRAPAVVRVLFKTYGADGVEAEARRAGIQHFVEKPLRSLVLLRELTRLLASGAA